MNHSYKITAFFKYSTEDHITKSKLEAMKKKVAEIISLVLTVNFNCTNTKKNVFYVLSLFFKNRKDLQ